VYWSGSLYGRVKKSVMGGGASGDGKRGVLCLARDRVTILSLVGTMRSPLTCVWAMRGSLRS